MEKKLVDCEVNKLECVLNCKDSKAFYRFPHDDKILQTWLDKLSMVNYTGSESITRICNNHFTEDMFEADGRRLKQSAVPVLNIPCKDLNITPVQTINNPPKTFRNIQSKPKILHLFDKDPKTPNVVINSISNSVKDSSNKGVDKNPKPVNPVTTSSENTKIQKPKTIKKKIGPLSLSKQRAEIIINRSSICFLKCKDAKHTYQFPKDEGSRKIWAEQLGLNIMPSRSSRLCRNHFSPKMFTCRNGLRLTRCAIPDINLPGMTIFTLEGGPVKGFKGDYWPEGVPLRKVDVPSPSNYDNAVEETDPTEISKSKMNEYFRAMLDPPFAIDSNPEISQPEILINPIENIKTAINQEHNKEGVLHVFQPARPQEEGRIKLPDNVDEGFTECVLKCTDTVHLFKFPNLELHRKVWLERVGLTHCYYNTMICDKHFSEKMFSKPKLKLIKDAFPDINLPKLRIKDTPRKLSDYRVVLPDHVCEVIELPEYICVLTVLKQNTEVDAAINGLKYIRHKVDITIPSREREVQVKASDLVSKVSIGILADGSMDGFTSEDSLDYPQLDWTHTFDSQMSKTEMFECLVCGEISVGYDCKIKHSNMHKESGSLCFQCGRLFQSQIKLRIHEKSKHFSEMRKALRCPKIHCKKAFHSNKQLLHHVEEHTKRSEYKCRKCKQVFISALKLHSHQTSCRSSWWPKYPKRVHVRRKRSYK